MKLNHAKQKLKNGGVSPGCFLGLNSPNVAEMLASIGFEWLVIDTEHSAADTVLVEHMIMAINTTEAIPLVRLPSGQQEHIQKMLDLGAMGIVVPMVRTAAEAREIVAATRYPPAGTRGYGGLRASRYNLDSVDYFQKASDNMLVMLILETREAVENLAEIAAVDGIDVIVIGPFDLCLSLGLNPLAQPHDEVEKIIDRALEIGKKHNVAIGFVYGTPEQVPQNIKRGFRALAYTDCLLLKSIAQNAIDVFKS